MMKADVLKQLHKISTELIICMELIEADKMHLATASTMQIEDEAKKLVRMMWRED